MQDQAQGQAQRPARAASQEPCAPGAVSRVADGAELVGWEPGERVEPRAAGPGAPLAAPIQAKMARAFGSDFSGVRVHRGGEAEALGARAYARGEQLFFAAGAYDPDSQAGQELIGHELAHVVQQREGRVGGGQGKGLAINVDPALEHAADDLGARAARGEIVARGAPGAAAAAGAVIQAMFEDGVSYDTVGNVFEATAASKTAKKPAKARKITGRIVGLGQTSTGDYEVWSYALGCQVTIAAKDAVHKNFDEADVQKGERGYVNATGPVKQHDLFVDRKGGDARRDKPAQKKQKFFQVEASRIPKAGKHGQGFDRRSIRTDKTGTERIDLMNDAAQHDELMEREELDPLTGDPRTSLHGVCNYTLQWGRMENMDSDHVFAQNKLPGYLTGLANQANQNPGDRARVAHGLDETGYKFGDFFMEKGGKYVPSQEGAQIMYTNTNNLVIANKATNQQDKNDADADGFLKKTLAHGQSFLDDLPPRDSKQPFLDDGSMLALHVRDNNRRGANQEAVQRNKRNYLQSLGRGDRSTRILSDVKAAESYPKGNKKRKKLERRASQRELKDRALFDASAVVESGFGSDDEGAMDKREVISDGLPFLFDQVDQGMDHDVRSVFQRVTSLEDKVRRRDKTIAKKDQEIADLKDEVRRLKKQLAKTKSKTK